MKSGHNSISRRISTGILLGFLILLALALIGDVRQVSAQLLAFRWSLLPVVLSLTLFNYSLRFIKWHYYLLQIGVKGFSLKESARLFVSGFPLAVTPGKAGEAFKGVWLNKACGIPIARGVAVVLAERVSDGLALLFLSTTGIIAYPRYWPAFVGILIVLLGIVVISQIRPLAYKFIDLGERLPIINRFAHSMLEFYEGSFSLFRPGATLIAVSLGAVSWLGEGIGMYIILIGLGVPSGWKTLSIAIFVLSFSIIVGAVSALPGGLGAAEASIAGMLTFLLGLEIGVSIAATLLIRFATLWFGVGLGLITWSFSRDLLVFGTNKHGVN